MLLNPVIFTTLIVVRISDDSLLYYSHLIDVVDAICITVIAWLMTTFYDAGIVDCCCLLLLLFLPSLFIRYI
jgi:hypothetical protein